MMDVNDEQVVGAMEKPSDPVVGFVESEASEHFLDLFLLSHP